MPNNQPPDFAEHVWSAAAIVGLNAPHITDAILKKEFPKTARAASSEGAAKMLRSGCIVEVKRILHTVREASAQADFTQIDPTFAPLVKRLQRPSYFVPELGEEMPVAELIAKPGHLDAARRFMRRKGMECLAEADRLDRLYEAVAGMPGDGGEIASILTGLSDTATQQCGVAA